MVCVSVNEVESNEMITYLLCLPLLLEVKTVKLSLYKSSNRLLIHDFGYAQVVGMTRMVYDCPPL